MNQNHYTNNPNPYPTTGMTLAFYVTFIIMSHPPGPSFSPHSPPLSPQSTSLTPTSHAAPALPFTSEVPAPPSQGPIPNSTQIRLTAFFIFLPAALLLAVAFYLHPDPHGHSTHQQLGLPSCAFLQRTGFPCPTCGMTTAASLAAHGHLLLAFQTQPFGALLALLSACAILISTWSFFTTASLTPILRRLNHLTTLWLILAFLLLAWLYKIIVIRTQ